jgi:hypothetical protein
MTALPMTIITYASSSNKRAPVLNLLACTPSDTRMTRIQGCLHYIYTKLLDLCHVPYNSHIQQSYSTQFLFVRAATSLTKLLICRDWRVPTWPLNSKWRLASLRNSCACLHAVMQWYNPRPIQSYTLLYVLCCTRSNRLQPKHTSLKNY